MTKESALAKANEVLEQQETRSHVCSFVNELASSKLITERCASSLADTLVAANGNQFPVLRLLIKMLE